MKKLLLSAGLLLASCFTAFAQDYDTFLTKMNYNKKIEYG